MPSEETRDLSSVFDVKCVCGQSHAGSRRRRHQQIICKECGTPLFVLPIDAYPLPSATGKSKNGKSKSGKRSSATAGAASVRDAVGKTAERIGQRIGAAATSLINGVFWFFSPVKLAIYAVAFTVIGTVWFLAHQKALATAETNIVTEAELGFEALTASEYEEAHAHLALAADAVRILDRTDEPSRRIEQAARESDVLAHLAPTSIIELVRRVDEAGVEESGLWKPAERLSVDRQWVAFDATVEKRSGRYAVALPIAVGERPNIFLRVDSPIMDAVVFEDATRTLTFAGQIESVERVSTAWNVVIDPDSLFLWESPGLYTELGFTIDPVWNTIDSVIERLEQQRLWQGGQPLPEDTAVGLEPAENSDEFLSEPENSTPPESIE